MSFDLRTFGRKNAKTVTTSCIVHGARVRLKGHCDDTVIGMAKLAAAQVEDVKFSFPRDIVSETHAKAETHTYEPAKAAIAINNGEALATEKPQKRKEVTDALAGVNGSAK